MVTGVSGGYDVNVLQLAADGASYGQVVIEANANQILDEADAAYAGFRLRPARSPPRDLE